MNFTKVIINYISGDDRVIDLRHQLLNITLAIGILFSGLAALSNFLLDLHWISIVMALLSLIVCSIAYYFTRFKRKRYPAIEMLTLGFIVFIFLPVLWFSTGGSNGSIQYFIPLMLVAIHVVFTGTTRVVLIAMLIASSLISLVVGYLYPQLIIPYVDEHAQYMDMVLGFSFSVAGIIIYLNIYYNMYTRANGKLEKQNMLLMNKQEEILAQQSEIEEHKFELERKAQSLQELNATKDRFFSIISHDLKNPFNSILGVSNVLMEAKQKIDDPEILQYIDVLNSSSKKSYQLLLNLLEWARLQSNDISYVPVKLDLKELIEENVNLVEAQILSKGLSIKFEYKEALSYIVLADEHMINSTVMNLISNAIKFTKKGIVEIILESNQDAVIIKFIDPGLGMSRKHVDSLFQIDKNISTPGTNFEQGTGLGLILCKEFVEKNGGNISVTSIPDKGSEFIVRLPSY
ncbi:MULTISPECIES: ATP-binding protein [unclassified Lentimicrobium]|uniref:ATP-binding protein n=1 Tax=unclassified Lentimicrobium TaxID=2677434 RepID=UPI0015517727|nr:MULTISPECIES: ATP-binding protein [unclassified Lentimicrobium]NPD47067.1 hypothetical protein [Lentimicrobium sp. S6]NPD84421.1 hypothetical protein [Lentimicrobium sp. L6]